MSDQPPDKKDIPEESDTEDQPSSKDPSNSNRIVILRERDIPFEEERPPNFSPNYSVTVHRVRKRTNREEEEE